MYGDSNDSNQAATFVHFYDFLSDFMIINETEKQFGRLLR